LHGWEGSVDSTYLQRCGRSLYRHGYDIFRLNFRDHGDSHHLNSGIFYAVLLEEVYQAVIQAAEFARGGPVFMIGFSLGGNFVLRILGKCVNGFITGFKLQSWYENRIIRLFDQICGEMEEYYG
jgi:predicted alpha/beta-fold hydrolase